MSLDQKFPLHVAQHWRLQELVGLLDQSLQVVPRVLLVPPRLLLELALLDGLVSADSESHLPSLVLLIAGLPQDDLGEGRLLDGDEILRVFTPTWIILQITLLFTVPILFYFYPSRSACGILLPGTLHSQLDRLGQFRNIQGIRREESQVKLPHFVLFELLLSVIDVGNDDVSSWGLLSLLEHNHVRNLSLEGQL